MVGELTTLGTLSFTLREREIKNLHQQLVILRLVLEGRQNRHQLADLLWAGVIDQRDQKGREFLTTRSLNTALSSLAACVPNGQPLFGGDPQRTKLWLRDPSGIACDTLRFQKAFAQGRYQQALRLIRGPFLAGFEEAFAQGRIRRHYLAAFELLAWINTWRTTLRRQHRFAQALANPPLELERDTALIERMRDADPSALPSCLEWLARQGRIDLGEIAREARAELASYAADTNSAADQSHRILWGTRLLERFDPHHQPSGSRRRIAQAFDMEPVTLKQVYDELLLCGWVDERGKVLAPSIIDYWLVDAKQERVEFLDRLALATHPGRHARSALALQEAFLADGGHHETEAHLKNLRHSAPHIAEILLAEGAINKVLEVLERVRDLEVSLGQDHDPGVLFWTAYALERAGRFREGLAVTEMAGEGSKDERLKVLEATLLFRVGEVTEAQRRAEALKPMVRTDSWASAQLANLKGNIAHAQEAFEDALENFRLAELKWRFLDPNRRVGELTNLGVVYDWMGDSEAAQAAFGEAIEVADATSANDLERLRTLYNWSVFLAEHGRTDDLDGIEERTKALLASMQQQGRYLPEAFEVHYLISVGISLQERGGGELARSRFQQASHLASELGNLTLQGQALIHLGEINDDHVEMRYGLELIEASGSSKDLEEYRTRYHNAIGEKEEL